MRSHRPSPVTRPRRTNLSRGQVAIIFAGAILTFVGLCAIVVDVSWYWANTLRVQRAADAAALAGAVYLPSSTNNGTGAAKAEAIAAAGRNGYVDGQNGITVTPTVDANDPRQLDVRIDGTVNSFFAHALGIKSWSVSRTGEGVYIQPVPMGSPDAYYGVGDYSTYVPTSNTTSNNGTTNLQSPDNNAPSGTWSLNAGRNKTISTVVQNNDNDYAFTSTINSQQQWANFGLATNNNSPIPVPAGNQSVQIRGIEVDLTDAFINANCGFNQSVKLQVELSWDNGVSWSTPQSTTGLNNFTNQDYVLGLTTSNTGWGAGNAGWGAHNWIRNDLTDGNFRVRATYLNTACGARTVDLDAISVNVGYTLNTTTTTYTLTLQTVKDPNGTVLPSRGAWGAMITKGGDHANGDAYGPSNNTDYDPAGYDYIVNLPSGGTISVFDPGFCAMGANGSGGSTGTGDHWIGNSGTPVSTYYTLYNTGGRAGLRDTWTKVYTSGTTFENQKGYDPANVDPNGGPPGGATSGCDPYHDTWWQFPGGNLPAGQYAVGVQTSKTSPPSVTADGTVNAGTNAENMWALDAIGTNAQIFGNGRMAVYNNLRAGQATQQFYLAQIDKPTGSGKTALIDIFDPGDVPGNGVLKVLSPNGGGQAAATFSYTTDANCVNNRSDACARNGVTQITTAVNGASSFNNTWIHISVAIPTTYGNAGLWQGGWWQIQYLTPGGGNDTTTWQVSVQGNPVHLIVP